MDIVDRYKKSKSLRRIGIWATWWWAASCFYALLFVWISLDNFAINSDWIEASGESFLKSPLLQVLMYPIMVGWVLGSIIWFKELKKQRISYRAALKDLFLRIRK